MYIDDVLNLFKHVEFHEKFNIVYPFKPNSSGSYLGIYFDLDNMRWLTT